MLTLPSRLACLQPRNPLTYASRFYLCASIPQTMYIVYIGGKPPKVTINTIDDDDPPTPVDTRSSLTSNILTILTLH
jgi:hypothetical protein